MSDTQGAEAGQKQAAPIIINGQYIKDLSFESPNVPDIFTDLQGKQPDINVTVNVNTRPLQGPNNVTLHEVVLEIQSSMKIGEKTGFLVELQYAGVFTLNLPEEHVGPVLMIECPRILFPFARQIISDATQQGGFMPLFLQPIDFAAMFQAGQQQTLANLDAEVAQLAAESKAD